MRAQTNTPKTVKKSIPMPVVIIVILVVVAVAALLVYRGTKNWGATYSSPISNEMISRNRQVMDAWNKEVALAKKEGRAPREDLRPGPAMQARRRGGGMSGGAGTTPTPTPQGR